MIKETNSWNPKKYNKHTAFVSQLAMPAVDLLEPKNGEQILDLGCGEGALALEIEKRGAKVIGVDLSEEMVKATGANGIEAYVGTATDLPYSDEFDAIFSNAMLHWVKESRVAVQNIAKALKRGGRFVAELGGEGNAYKLVKAMQEVFENHKEFGTFNNPWHFPSVQEYSDLLNSEGLRVEYIELIPRPTLIDDISNWLDIFANGITKDLTPGQFEIFKLECRDILKEQLYAKESGWSVDYVRLRLKAVKL
ncbi:MAG TPA: class I SAM-dependent methyltransferase [Nitratifractor sp.]|nr:class I SAM-dependent methyltransferase [Nitratifractor sp.]HHD75078.1 class I SAM-dependent methyltransferase [Nitratifractor sp.]HHH20462.1 class I SAM-dependent methyltransferase [Nitratifractor sp.]